MFRVIQYGQLKAAAFPSTHEEEWKGAGEFSTFNWDIQVLTLGLSGRTARPMENEEKWREGEMAQPRAALSQRNPHSQPREAISDCNPWKSHFSQESLQPAIRRSLCEPTLPKPGVWHTEQCEILTEQLLSQAQRFKSFTYSFPGILHKGVFNWGKAGVPHKP